MTLISANLTTNSEIENVVSDSQLNPLKRNFQDNISKKCHLTHIIPLSLSIFHTTDTNSLPPPHPPPQNPPFFHLKQPENHHVRELTMQETLHFSSSSSFSLPKSSISPPKSFKSSTISYPQHPKPPTPISTSTSLPTPPPPQNFHLQEKLLFLDSLGVDSLHCLSSQPLIVSSSLSDLKSVIDFLYSVNLSILDVRRVLHMCPEILTAGISTTLRPAVTFLLREALVTGEKLPGILRRRPRLLTKCVEKNLRPTLYFLQSTIGIEDVSKCATLLSCSVETKFIPRMDYLQRIGFSRRDAKVMFRRFPSLFCYSIEENLEPKFDYFVVEMGRELKELIVFPQYFSFSLENRIKPRHKMCVERGVCLSLPVMLKSHESRFRDRLEVCCSSSMPLKIFRGSFRNRLSTSTR